MKLLASVAVVLSATICVVGCATNPADLATPQKITCVELEAPLSFTASYGMIPVKYTTRLEKGAYVSEKLDDGGTYYRAPPGGLSVTRADGVPFPGMPVTMDGGFYIPNDASKPVWIYRYFSTAAAPVDPSGRVSSCATIAYLKDPVTKKLSIVRLAAAGAAGGAAGGILGRSIAKGSSLSYGQAAGVGAVSGIVAGALIGSIINMGVGKIIPALAVRDTTFMDRLRELSATGVALPQLQRKTSSGASAPGSSVSR